MNENYYINQCLLPVYGSIIFMEWSYLLAY